ncbi:isoleucine--tRNA ligase [candidate division FCPU426 bacterium]|nr:isoleucine--tRNA ligase [candidate division FCPU426 bacterium]
MDYRETLNLPQTDFPMKADLQIREPELQARWAEMDLYGLLRQKNSRKSKFVLHDGPPYANGDVHLGTAFNKISKDIIVKYKSMRGLDAPYVPGWDCHGMPIEHKVVGQLSEAEAADHQRVRAECRKYAERFVNIQREQFKRLGVLGDWDHPYLTMSPDYQATIVRVFGELALKGFIYRGLKPVYWCTNCQSALAEAEVEYTDLVSPSITVRFEVVEGWPQAWGQKPAGRIYIPIWTTTPWTLPANRAVAVHPEFAYVLVESGGDYYILAKELAAANSEAWQRPFAIKAEITGGELAGLRLRHPFVDITVPVIQAKYVTLDAGTGCVHTAPGHGQDDYVSGLENNLEVFNPVGVDGRFTQAFPEMQGEFVLQANPRLIELLRHNGSLLQAGEISHAYPHCWRHRTPIIFRATEQWFMRVDKDHFRRQVLEQIHNEVAWIPAASENRISSMVEGRPDWCLSRQRSWGVPLPIFYCEACSAPLLSAEVFAAVESLFAGESADAWFQAETEKIVPPGTRCAECGAGVFRKETDILDVWFDSGVSHAAVLDKRRDLKFPADIYLEGSDQHRGWFQVSLLTSSATKGKPPYKTVLTHGYTVDGEGRKMSKSLGNFITAQEAGARYGGADIIRLWVTSENIQNDVRFSEEIFKRMTDSYRRMRNTLRFLLGNLHGFTPDLALRRKDQDVLDRYLLHRLQELVASATQACDAYEFHRFYQLLQNFCAADLSAFYFDVLKDRLYADGKDSRSRLSAQTTLWQLLRYLVRLIAPVLAHTAEETWLAMRAQGLIPAKEEAPSVHLAAWLTTPNEWRDPQLARVWSGLLEIRSVVLKKLEEARNQKSIRHPYEAMVRIRVRGPQRSLLAAQREQLASCFVVSAVELEEAGSAGPEMMIWVEKASGGKCERCWRHLTSVGKYEDHPGLCERCHEAVTAMTEKQKQAKV